MQLFLILTCCFVAGVSLYLMFHPLIDVMN